MMRKTPTTVLLDEYTSKILAKMKERTGRSMSNLIRIAIIKAYAEEVQEGER